MPAESPVQPSSICLEAQTVLSSSPLYDLRELRIEEADDRKLVIRGMVSSFYHKQLAQEMVLALAKRKSYRVINSVEVMDTLSN